MSDIGDTWKELKRQKQIAAEKRRQRAYKDFEEALSLARTFGFTLVRHTDVHYTLVDGTVRLDLYPGNQRIYRPVGNEKVPFVRVPNPWGLSDFVKAYASKEL